MNVHTDADFLVCPETKQPVRARSLEAASAAMCAGQPLVARAAEHSPPFGPTPTVMLRQDNAAAYPVVKGVPVLFVPEMLLPAGQSRRFDLNDPKYAEAYQEMTFYNKEAERQAENIEESNVARTLAPILTASPAQRAHFPEPPEIWLDAPYDAQAQMDSYRHIMPVQDKRVLQLGGSGSHAVKLLCAGAKEAWLITPIQGETSVALALARLHGVEDRLRCVVGVGEELPFADSSFDIVFCGACLHHTITSVSLPECARILRQNGKFAAFEPWRAPLYAIGTKIFGKREKEVFCKPITAARARPLYDSFFSAEVVHHGAITRYPLLAMSKLGLRLSLPAIYKIVNADDTVCALVSPLRKWGSSIAMLGTKPDGD